LEAEHRVLLVRAELAAALPHARDDAAKKDETAPTPPPSSQTVKTLYSRITHPPTREGPPPRGFPGQRFEREREYAARRHAVEVGEQLLERGWPWNRVARLLGLAERTLRDWHADFIQHALHAEPLGRPIHAANREERNEVIHDLDELCPGVGVPTLRHMFPHLARATIEHLVERYRRVWRKRNFEPIHVLHWTRPRRPGRGKEIGNAEYESVAEAEKRIVEYVMYYRFDRKHSWLGYFTPHQFVVRT